MQLTPGETFVVVRQLSDPLDTSTYYVQAVIRNAADDSTLETLNLTDKGEQRFAKNWIVAKDGSGNGRYISITTRVYTDSGYTNLSPIYGIDEREYVIDTRWNHALGGGGGGVDIDYERLRRMVREEVAKKEIPLTNIDPVLSAIAALPSPENMERELSSLSAFVRKDVPSSTTLLTKSISQLEEQVKRSLKDISGRLFITSTNEIRNSDRAEKGVEVLQKAVEALQEAVTSLVRTMGDVKISLLSLESRARQKSRAILEMLSEQEKEVEEPAHTPLERAPLRVSDLLRK